MRVLCINDYNQDEGAILVKKGHEYPCIKKDTLRCIYAMDPDNFLYYCLFEKEGVCYWYHSSSFIDITDISQEDIDEYKRLLNEE